MGNDCLGTIIMHHTSSLFCTDQSSWASRMALERVMVVDTITETI